MTVTVTAVTAAVESMIVVVEAIVPALVRRVLAEVVQIKAEQWE